MSFFLPNVIVWDKVMRKKSSETISGQIKNGKWRGGGRGVDNLKTDFHAYYTNDFMIFDVAVGVGRVWRPEGGGGEGVFFSLSSRHHG